MKIQQIYHKKNELFEVEFYEDKECTIPFDFYNKNAEDLYIDGLNGDITPLIAMEDKIRRTAKEYVKDGYIHTNTIEGYFGLFKRGMKGIYQHCKSQHLKRYLCEFDFRYNRRDLNDVNRAVEIVANAFGKRLKYKEVLVA